MWQSFRARIPDINSWLLTAICFLLPTQVAPIYILCFCLLVLFVLQKDILYRMRTICAAPINWAFVSYYGVFLLSMLWTTDTKWGWHIVGRQIPFLLFPLFWSAAKEEDQRRYLSAFITSIAMCVILAQYNWLQMHVFTNWPVGIRVQKSPEDTSPFVDHIMYAPMLAFGAYFVGYRFLFESNKSKNRLTYLLLFAAIVINLLLSGGRAGLVGFFALIVTLIAQRLPRHPVKALSLSLLAVTVIFGAGYSASSYLRERTNSGFAEAMNPSTNINSSVGLRINFLINSGRLFLANPLIGVGAGDFPSAYEKVNKEHTPQAITTVNPHNQFMLILSSTGMLGGLSLLFLLWMTLGPTVRSTGQAKHYVVALWIGYAVICMFESYLWRSNTALAFCTMAALFHKNLCRSPYDR
jgi:O-antigen ligase